MKASEHARVWREAANRLEIHLDKAIKTGRSETAIGSAAAATQLALAIADAYEEEAENASD